MRFYSQVGLLLTAAAAVMAAPFDTTEVSRRSLDIRENTTINPDAITDTTCTDSSTDIVFHDQNVAQLAICGGIAGTIEFCGGDPTTTVGESGTAKFTLTAIEDGATINVSKGRWEGCVRAARAVCPTGNFESTCIGGTTDGNFEFTLEAQ